MQKIAALTLASALVSGPAMAAEIVRDGEAIYLTGIIQANDYAKFVAADAGQGTVVCLSSNGIHTLTAMDIGYHIRNRNMATVVPIGAQCASGCVFVWAAGNPREVEYMAQIGVHCPRPEGISVCNAAWNGRVVEYLRSMGAPEQMIALQARTGLPTAWLPPDFDKTQIAAVPTPRSRPIVAEAEEPKPAQTAQRPPVSQCLPTLLSLGLLRFCL